MASEVKSRVMILDGTVQRFPSERCTTGSVKLSASAANGVVIGGVDDGEGGPYYPLAPGQQIGFDEITNIDQFTFKGTAGTDEFYIIYRKV